MTISQNRMDRIKVAAINELTCRTRMDAMRMRNTPTADYKEREKLCVDMAICAANHYDSQVELQAAIQSPNDQDPQPTIMAATPATH